MQLKELREALDRIEKKLDRLLEIEDRSPDVEPFRRLQPREVKLVGGPHDGDTHRPSPWTGYTGVMFGDGSKYSQDVPGDTVWHWHYKPEEQQ